MGTALTEDGSIEGSIRTNVIECLDLNDISLPCANENDESTVYRTISVAKKVPFEPVGRWFEVYQSRKHSRRTTSCHSVESEESSDDDSSTPEEETPEEIAYLRSLDPKDWKSQDHYNVFGLKDKRHAATDAEIKKAYRLKVLRHHPDKRRNAGEVVRDLELDYFSCITRSYEILGNLSKRRAYDSVDPEFNDDIPPNNTYSKENFFKVYPSIFERNARWSNKQPVPSIGNEKSTYEEVDYFYKFWYDFDSWREFSYLDEEEKEKGENREERRWIEKQNKSARQKLKKEEMTRIRQLVDNACSSDPRIQRFKDEEKQRKLAQRQAKIDAARAKTEEEERIKNEALEAERKVKEKQEGEAKALREKEKKEKEAYKKLLKKERKLLQLTCQTHGYFAKDETQRVTRLKEVDLLGKMLTLERIQALNEAMQRPEEIESAFLKEVDAVNEQLQKEKDELAASLQRTSISSTEVNPQKPWNHDDVQLLVKAVNLFPAGTSNRWEVVAAFINQHTASGLKRTAKESLAKAKDLQKLDTNLKEEVNKKAYEKLEKSHQQKPATTPVVEESVPTERFDTPAEQQGLNNTTWTADEQKLLEQALKSFPTTLADRWDKIAEAIPGRSKKDCMKRYKDLVELVRAKKAAQAAALKTKK